MFFQIVLALALVPMGIFSAPRNTSYTPKEYQKILKQGFTTNWFKSENPLSKYNETSIQQVYDRNFRNLRIRCNSKFFNGSYDTQKFKSFLNNLTLVVDKCLEVILLILLIEVSRK